MHIPPHFPPLLPPSPHSPPPANLRSYRPGLLVPAAGASIALSAADSSAAEPGAAASGSVFTTMSGQARLWALHSFGERGDREWGGWDEGRSSNDYLY